ncbi:endoplasmin [Artemisia annua]|uniref:Endoplasmin n=1 Tax=Artemisia annua TaxID=35608 RepID=A0A2U1NA89_ARTAN|nr:endoplasmin [Artemisia annua]
MPKPTPFIIGVILALPLEISSCLEISNASLSSSNPRQEQGFVGFCLVFVAGSNVNGEYLVAGRNGVKRLQPVQWVCPQLILTWATVINIVKDDVGNGRNQKLRRIHSSHSERFSHNQIVTGSTIFMHYCATGMSPTYIDLGDCNQHCQHCGAAFCKLLRKRVKSTFTSIKGEKMGGANILGNGCMMFLEALREVIDLRGEKDLVFGRPLQTCLMTAKVGCRKRILRSLFAMVESVTRKNLRSNAEKFELQAEALDKIRFLSITDKEVLGEGDDNKLEIQV